VWDNGGSECDHVAGFVRDPIWFAHDMIDQICAGEYTPIKHDHKPPSIIAQVKMGLDLKVE
jgi:hypothetical protein